MKNISPRTIIVLLVIFGSLLYVLPSFHIDVWPHKKINLGLDLQGGMHLVLEVEAEKAVESTIERMSNELRRELKTNHIKFLDLRRKGFQISLQVLEDKGIEKFDQLLDDEFPEFRIVSRNQNGNNLSIVLDLPESDVSEIKQKAAEQALETIRNRIDEFGVSEPDIRRQGERRILIQLPGVKDPRRAKELIGKTALLEFKLVDDKHTVEDALKGKVPPGMEILYQVTENRQTRRASKTPFLVEKRTTLTGEYLTDARVNIDSQYNEPYVSIKFNKKGARLFERITETNVQRRLAIVLDQKIHSAPVIQERISGGEARITGSFTHEEAHDLAIVLRAGALPAPVHILEERTVGPSLGADSIRMGLLSMLIGGLLVIAFMIIYYKTAGLIADIALGLNIVLIAAGLAGFQATLTLPGIAGIILTIGMAVDANVIIFERIREELRVGKSPLAAVDAGYSKATLTILDANVTTLIAAIVLFQFGTGPVKGFAVTLSLGVIASLFTALIVSRQIFDSLLVNRQVRSLSI
ncbi:preprotein translocase subunit SecD [Candidatus Magnetomorum sp. HK-1]|nr:preprotein translocase subunit SecD [Candidatus Magnetomorum sp. HK-1]